MNMENRTQEIPQEMIRARLKEALEHLSAAGHSAHELVRLSVDTFGHRVIPFLSELQDEVRSGRIKMEHVSGSAKIALFGLHVTAQQREQMIREAAYLLAEKRGFVDGSPQEDWLRAEQNIDKFLAKQEGIIVKGRKLGGSVTEFTERGLAQLKDRMDRWIGSAGRTATYH